MWALAESGPTLDWTQYGPALAICGVVIFGLSRMLASKEAVVAAKDVEIKRLNEEHARVLIGLTERMSPLLADATKTLERTEQGMNATLQRGTSGLDEQLDLLKRAVSEIARKIEER